LFHFERLARVRGWDAQYEEALDPSQRNALLTMRHN
jgi:hypothetical protein